MPLTDWRATQSDGTIADTPATCFRYKYVIDFWHSFAGSSGIVNTTLEGDWRLRVVNTDDETIFEQEVHLSYQLVALVIGFAGNPWLSTYIWWYVDGSERIRTTTCGTDMALAETASGVTVAQTTIPLTNVQGVFPVDGPAWLEQERIEYDGVAADILSGVNRGIYAGPWGHAAGVEVREAPPTIGVEQGIAVPAGGGDYTNIEGHVMTEWMSPVYELAVPAGARVVIDFHNVGLQALSKSVAAIQTQVCAGAIACTRDPWQGVSWAVLPESGDQVVRSIHDNGTTAPFTGSLPSDLGTAHLVRYPHTTRLGLICDVDGDIRYTESFAEGQEGTWTAMATIIENVDLLNWCLGEDGGTHYLLVREAGVMKMLHAMANGDGTYTVVDKGAVSGITEPGSYMQQQFGSLHIVGETDGNVVHYVSADGGVTWA